MEPTQAAEQAKAEEQREQERTEPPDLEDPSLYENRELSWLDFNDRVLQLAEDESMPLIERAKFLAIYQSNLDEFFMVRVAGLHDQVDAGVGSPGSDGLTPTETIDCIAQRVAELGQRHSEQWSEHVLPELAEHGIRIVTCEACDDDELEAVDRVFREQIFATLTPLGVGPGRPFPYISNLSLSLAVWLRDPVSEVESFARVKVPKEVLPRFVPIGEGTYIPLENAIARHLDQLFPGMEIVSHDVFRVARDADFTVSDEADDLLEAVEEELRRRRFGEVVRLEVGATMEEHLREKLVAWLKVEERQVYDVEGMLDLTDLWELDELEGHADLKEPAHSPVTPYEFHAEEGERPDIFAAMRSNDVLIHQPYESFSASVIRFVEQAVADPDVLAIKLTVYRTDDESSLIPALIRAAEQGKQAVCMLELKARFDERRNIVWARALEEAGAHVVHGVPGLKTHAKALLVVRREGDGVRNYCHIGTGNYNAKTARLYEDFGLFTTEPKLTADVADLFNSLTGYARPQEFRKALVSPQYLREGIIDEIEKTAEAAENGEDARIAMKMNALVDARCIRALYRASQAGVQVDLNVRGICRLRPGVEGVSDNIRVVSIVGRFLEHSRIYSFHRGDESHYFIGSADLMPRNLDSRVELVAPVEDPELQGELEDTLQRCFADDTFAWVLRLAAAHEGRAQRARGADRTGAPALVPHARRITGVNRHLDGCS
jgi:polyphosphate kinase